MTWKPVVDAARKTAGSVNVHTFKSALTHVITKEQEQCDAATHSELAWNLLDRALSAPTISGGHPMDPLLFVLGLPSLGPVTATTGVDQVRRADDLLAHLASYIATRGLNVAEADLKTAASRLLGGTAVPAEVSNFFSDIRALGCRTGEEFRTRPLQLYRPKIGSVPPWWTTLSCSVLEDLLGLSAGSGGSVASPGPSRTRKKKPVVVCTNYIGEVDGIALVRGTVDLDASYKTTPMQVQFYRKAARGQTPSKVGTSYADSWTDSSPPTHKVPLEYTGKSMEPASSDACKVISLDVFDARGFVRAKKARRSKPPKQASAGSATWKQDIEVGSEGFYDIEVFCSSDVHEVEFQGHRMSSPGGVPATDRVPRSGKDSVQLGTPVEVERAQPNMQVRFYDKNGKQLAEHDVSWKEVKTEGKETPTRYEWYLQHHMDGRQPGPVDPEDQLFSSRLLDGTDTWRPVIACWSDLPGDRARRAHNPWDTSTPHRFLGQTAAKIPAPYPALNPPTDLLQARKAIVSALNLKKPESIEQLKLHQVVDESLVNNLVDAYQGYLAACPSEAPYFDTLLLYALDDGEPTDEPTGLLLTPLHPLRLAWQWQAQDFLGERLHQETSYCPSVGLLCPSSVPDSMLLPLALARNGPATERAYFSRPCASPYWGLLWNHENFGSDVMDSGSPKQVLHDNLVILGLEPKGVLPGFGKEQVSSALNDLQRLEPCRDGLTVQLVGDDTCPKESTQGIFEWARDRFSAAGTRSGQDLLGQSDKAGNPAWGARRIDVVDQRGTSHPSPGALAEISEATAQRVRWYRPKSLDKSVPIDLVFVDKLPPSRCKATATRHRSAVSPSALVQARIRTDKAGRDVTETRCARQPPVGTGAGPRPKVPGLATLVTSVESLTQKDSNISGFQHTPGVGSLSKYLAGAGFAALTSGQLDPGCVVRAALGSTSSVGYLWDYQQPFGTEMLGSSSGYYLLATARAAAKKTLQEAVGLVSTSSIPAKDVMEELSESGLPVARRIIQGANHARGALGMLLAKRLLMGNRAKGEPGLFQQDPSSGTAHLLIPVDPFETPLGVLARTIDRHHAPAQRVGSLRPDLLLVCIRGATSATTVEIDLLPIEVKFRDAMDTGLPQSAREQASSLSRLLQELWDLRKTTALWRDCSGAIFGQLLEMGFRLTTPSPGDESAWADCHQVVEEALLWKQGIVRVDPLGRALIFYVDGRAPSETVTLTDESSPTVLLVSKKDCSALMDDPEKLSDDLLRSVGNLDLCSSGGDQVGAESPGMGESTEGESPVVAGDEAAVDASEESTSTGQAGGVGGGTGAVVDPPGAGFPPEPQADPTTDPVAPVVAEEASGELAGEAIETEPEVEAESSTEPASDPGEGMRFEVGHRIHELQPVPIVFHPSNTDLTHLNIGIVGDMGTGKTQLTKYIVTRIVRGAAENRGHRPRFLIFDYKKDYSHPDFVDAVGAKLVPPEDIPLNVFSLRPTVGGKPHGRRDWVNRANFLYDNLGKIYAGIGSVQKEHLKTATIQAYEAAQAEHGGPPVLSEVLELYREAAGGKADTITSVLGDLVDMGVFSEDRSTLQDFDTFLDGVVVVQVGELGANSRDKNALVVFFLNLFYDFMLQLEKKPFVGNSPQLRFVEAMLLVDEADNIMRGDFEVLRNILQEGREFGVGVLLASQYLAHFKTSAYNYAAPLLTWFVHKVPEVRESQLKDLGIPEVSKEVVVKIRGLGKFQYFCKTLGEEGGTFGRGKTFWETYENEWKK